MAPTPRPVWHFLSADERAVQQLRQQLSLHPALCRVLVQRGIDSAEKAEEFFRPSLSQLHAPFDMEDMERAVERLRQAIERREGILLYGDYDVDGTTGVALLYIFLSRFHPHVDYYLPHREREGYGLSLDGVRYARERGSSLIIAVDCGTHAHEAIAAACATGIDVIVCDHHLSEGNLPPAYAVLNPQRPGCSYPNKYLSGCGVAFKLVQAYASTQGLDAADLEDLLDLVTLSTCCDLVPLVGENRAFVASGLQRMERRPRTGVWALLQKGGISPPLRVRDLVLGVGPLLNAAGRMGDARDAVRALLSVDRNSALEQAAQLAKRNRQRQHIERAATEDAVRRLVQEADFERRKSIVLFAPDCPKGVVGIVASRLVERFHRPAVVLAQSAGMAVGSGRSIPGFHLYEALCQCRHLLSSFGGHAYAAGVQLPIEHLQNFSEQFEAVVQERLPPEASQPVLPLCAELTLTDITPAFWKALQSFAPFGPGNMTPIFWANCVADTGQSRILRAGHVQFSVRQGRSPVFTGIGFGLAELFAAVRHGPLDIAFSLQEDRFWGEGMLQLRIRDLRPASS